MTAKAGGVPLPRSPREREPNIAELNRLANALTKGSGILNVGTEEKIERIQLHIFQKMSLWVWGGYPNTQVSELVPAAKAQIREAMHERLKEQWSSKAVGRMKRSLKKMSNSKLAQDDEGFKKYVQQKINLCDRRLKEFEKGWSNRQERWRQRHLKDQYRGKDTMTLTLTCKGGGKVATMQSKMKDVKANVAVFKEYSKAVVERYLDLRYDLLEGELSDNELRQLVDLTSRLGDKTVMRRLFDTEGWRVVRRGKYTDDKWLRASSQMDQMIRGRTATILPPAPEFR